MKYVLIFPAKGPWLTYAAYCAPPPRSTPSSNFTTSFLFGPSRQTERTPKVCRQTRRVSMATQRINIPLLQQSGLRINSRSSPFYSTVTDFAKLRGKSTFRPSITASQYAISCSGMTFKMPCSTSTVLGISIVCACSLPWNSSSPVLQITMGLPPRDTTVKQH